MHGTMWCSRYARIFLSADLPLLLLLLLLLLPLLPRGFACFLITCGRRSLAQQRHPLVNGRNHASPKAHALIQPAVGKQVGHALRQVVI